MFKTYMRAIKLLHMEYVMCWGENNAQGISKAQKTAQFINKRLKRYKRGN